MVAYLVAAALAVTVVELTTDFPRRPYWWHWDPANVVAGFGALYLLYVAMAVAVTALARHLGWEVLSGGAGRDWANGVAYGMVAVALTRLEINGLNLEHFAPGRLIHQNLIRRLAPALDAGTERTISRKVGDLRRKQLAAVSLRVFKRHALPEILHLAPPDRRYAIAAVVSARLDALREVALTHADPADPAAVRRVIDAQEDLRHYIETLIVEFQDAKIRIPAEDDVPG